MAIETIEKIIDERTVRCTPLKARAGARLLARLLKHIGPAMSKLQGVNLKQLQASTSMMGDLSAFAPAISGLFESLSPEDFDTLAVEILSRMTIVLPDEKGALKKFDLSSADQIDNAFTGDLMLMFKCMAFALEVNYAGFFLALGNSGESAGAPDSPAPPLPSPQ